MNPPVVPSKPEVVMPPLNSTAPISTSIGSMTSSSSIPPRRNKKTILAIVAVIILTITTLSGFILIARPVLFKSNAWNCGSYTFGISASGSVTVNNNSTTDEALQRADVFVNNQLVQTFDVPALPAGESRTLGTVTVPASSFSWQINGTSDCSNAGRVEINETSYQCQNIKAYSEDGTRLYTSEQLSALAADSKIRIVAAGSGSASNYSAVRFTVNGTLLPPSILKDSNDNYYDVYTIPTGVNNFAITAQLKGSDGTWY